MSNCIDIVYKSVIDLKPYQIDAVGLRNLITKAEEEVNNDNSVSEKVPTDLRAAWWYLSANTVFLTRGGVRIFLGRGRSSHTWRDFRWTLSVLKQFIRSPVIVRFGITDEYDNHKSIVRTSVDLQKGLR